MDKTQEKQVVLSTLVHHLLTDAQPAAPSDQLPQFIYWG